MIASPAPTARPAIAAPSRTRCGSSRSSTRSFLLAGSPSEPLATRIFGLRRAATARSFVDTGNDAPPRPRSPACSTSSTICAGDNSRRSGSGPCRSRCASRSLIGRSPIPVSNRGSGVTSVLIAITGCTMRPPANRGLNDRLENAKGWVRPRLAPPARLAGQMGANYPCGVLPAVDVYVVPAWLPPARLGQHRADRDAARVVQSPARSTPARRPCPIVRLYRRGCARESPL